MMKLTNKHRWMLTAGLTGMVASRLTERLLARSWRAAAGKDPPLDAARNDVDWRTAIVWSATAGAVAAASEVLARQGAAKAWQRVTGRKPPRLHNASRRGGRR